jgi:hypothetical protein
MPKYEILLIVADQAQSERKKFSRSCLDCGGKRLKLLITALASDCGLACARIAWGKSLVRPSCRKKRRCPIPHKGADRNSCPSALPVRQTVSHVVDGEVAEWS